MLFSISSILSFNQSDVIGTELVLFLLIVIRLCVAVIVTFSNLYVQMYILTSTWQELLFAMHQETVSI